MLLLIITCHTGFILGAEVRKDEYKEDILMSIGFPKGDKAPVNNPSWK